MGLNAVLMDVTMTIRDAELSCEDGDSSDQQEEDGDDNLMLIQGPSQTSSTSALQRLPEHGRSRATMKLRQMCGGWVGDNGQALEALLVAHEVAPDNGWLQMWWGLLCPHLSMAGADPTAASSSSRLLDGGATPSTVAAFPDGMVVMVVNVNSHGGGAGPTQLDDRPQGQAAPGIYFAPWATRSWSCWTTCWRRRTAP